MSGQLDSTTERRGVATFGHGLDDPEQRDDAAEKVTGRARYAADQNRNGMLWAAVVGSPFAHARILAVDAEEATQMSGVHTVLTGADLRPARFGRRLLDRPVLAWDRVRFVGERVAAVAAETREAAEEAARRITVRYAELPAVFDPSEALRSGAIVLHDHPGDYHYIGNDRPEVSHANLQSRLSEGMPEAQIDAALARADRVFEHTFATPRQHHGYLEPRATLVDVRDDGMVHVVSTNKAPQALREQLAAATGVPVERVVVHSDFIGGDFGGKGFSVDEFLCYFLAQRSGRPVKSVTSYVDDLWGTNHRHAASIRMKTGVGADGRFLAHKAQFLFDGGAYAAAKPNPTLSLSGATGACMAPYRVGHMRVDVSVAYTNNVPGGHMRSPGHVQATFATESHVDMIARSLRMDPVELRLRNAVVDGDRGPLGQPYVRPRAIEVLETLSARTPLGAVLLPHHGRGLALAEGHVGGGREARVRLRLRPDATVEAFIRVSDQGAGARTVVARVVAAVLSIDPTLVTVSSDDRLDVAAVDVGASRVTHVISQAAAAAAAALLQRIGEGQDGDGPSFTDRSLTALRDGPVEVEGRYDGKSASTADTADFNFAGCVVEVEVDTDTGEVTVCEAVLAVDAGTIINPVGHQGQIEGGFVYGLGAAMSEELPREAHQRPIGTGLGGYEIPTIADVPPLQTVVLANTDGPGAFGAKAIGELTNVLAPAAVANAVAAATGARVSSFPVTGRRILAALQSADAAAPAPPPQRP